MRLFAALPLPEPFTDRLAALTDGLPGGRVVPDEDFHVTLGFFDELDRHAAADLDAELAAIRAGPPRVAIDGLGTFGSPPRTLFAAVRADAALTHLRDKVVQAARGAGVDIRRTRFHPHVTLARLGPADGGPALDRWIAAHAGIRVAPVTIPAFCLYQSQRGRGGAVYTELVRYRLSPDPS